MLATVLLLGGSALALNAAAPSTIELPAAGLRLPLDRGFTLAEEGSSREQAATGPGGLQVFVSRTPYQVDLDLDAAREAARLATARLQRLGAASPAILATTVEREGAHLVAHTVAEGEHGGRSVYLSQRSFAVQGALVHVTAVGLRVEQVSDTTAELVGRAQVAHGPDPVVADLASREGHRVHLPEGWRAPIGAEAQEARRLLAMPDAETCWLALHPLGDGTTRLLQGCPLDLHLGLVDELSLDTVDHQARALLFGPAGAAFSPAALTVDEGRPILTWIPPAKGKQELAVAAAPVGERAYAIWAVGPSGEEAETQAALAAAITGTEWSAGPYVVSGRDRLDHALAHRPALVGLALSPLLVGMGLVARKIHRMPSYSEDPPYDGA